MLAAALAGCGKKTDSNGNTETATTAPVAQQQTAAEETETGGSVEDATVKPTVRERNIVSNDTYEYEIYKGGAIITKYKGSMTEVVIPDEIDGAHNTEKRGAGSIKDSSRAHKALHITPGPEGV